MYARANITCDLDFSINQQHLCIQLSTYFCDCGTWLSSVGINLHLRLLCHGLSHIEIIKDNHDHKETAVNSIIRSWGVSDFCNISSYSYIKNNCQVWFCGADTTMKQNITPVVICQIFIVKEHVQKSLNLCNCSSQLQFVGQKHHVCLSCLWYKL